MGEVRQRFIRIVSTALITLELTALIGAMPVPAKVEAVDDPIVTACQAAQSNGKLTITANVDRRDDTNQQPTATIDNIHVSHPPSLGNLDAKGSALVNVYQKGPNDSQFQPTKEDISPASYSSNTWNYLTNNTNLRVANAVGYTFIFIARYDPINTIDTIDLQGCLQQDEPASTGSTELTKYDSWFIKDVSGTIKIDKTEGTDHAPSVTIPGDSTQSNRPVIVFRLTDVNGVGGQNLSDQRDMKWLTFRAYQNSVLLPGLYLLGDDNGPNWSLWYSQDESGLPIGDFSDSTNILHERFTVDSISFNELFRYLLKYPSSTTDTSNDCLNGTITSTGPKAGPNGEEVIAPAKTNGGDDIRLLSPDCINVNSDKNKSWLTWWGINTSSVTNLDSKTNDCGFGSILDPRNNVSTSVGKILQCVIVLPLQTVIGSLVTGMSTLGDKTTNLEDNLAKPDSDIVKAWQFSRSLLNILVIVALLAIAFTNIFHLNLKLYLAKQTIPRLIWGVIGANASLLIIRFLLDTVKALNQLAYELAGVASTGTPLKSLIVNFIGLLGQGAIASATGALGKFSGVLLMFAVFLLIAGMVYFIVLVVGFGWQFLKRLIYLYVLTALAPLGYAAYGLPGTDKYFYQWWNMFLQQAFVLPIVLLAMALYIKFSTVLLNGATPSWGPDDYPGLIASVMLLASATLVIKIPGLVTKGALDMTKTAQNAFNWAKNSPASVYGGIQGGAAGMKKRYDAKAALAANQADKDRFEKIAKRWGGYADKAGGFRGRSYIIANPDKTIKKWYEERTAAAEKESIKQASMVNIGNEKIPILGKRNLAGMVAGAPGDYLRTKGIIQDDARRATTLAEAEGMLVNPDQKKLAQLLRQYEDSLATAEEKAQYRGKVIAASKLSDWEKLMNEANVPLDQRGTPADRARVWGYYTAKQSSIRSQRGRSGKYLGDDWDKSKPPTPYGSYAAGTAATQAGQAETEPAFEDIVQSRVAEVVNHATKLRTPADVDSLQERLQGKMANWNSVLGENIDNLDETALNRVTQLRQETRSLLTEGLADDATELRDTVNQLVSGPINQQSSAELVRMLENQSLALQTGNDPAKIEQAIRSSEQGKQESRRTYREFINNSDPNQMAEAINQAMIGSNTQLASLLRPVIEQTGKNYNMQVDTRKLEAISQNIATNISQLSNTIGGRDQRSLRTILTKGLEAIPKQLGVNQLNDQAMYGQIRDALNTNPQPRPAEPPATLPAENPPSAS